jgi:hypothetical protein
MARLATLIGHDGEIWLGLYEWAYQHHECANNEQCCNLLSRFHRPTPCLLKDEKHNRFGTPLFRQQVIDPFLQCRLFCRSQAGGVTCIQCRITRATGTLRHIASLHEYDRALANGKTRAITVICRL